MKNTITFVVLLLVFFTNVSCAQTIIPLEELRDIRAINNDMDDDEIYIPPQPIYFKDINHYLDKYVGTWEGTFAGKTYRLIVIKTISHDTDPVTKTDELEGSYTVTDTSTGDVLVDTMNLPHDSDNLLKGLDLDPEGRGYSFIYNGFESRCGQEGTMLITMNENYQTLMYLRMSPRNDMIMEESCPNGVAQQVFPTDEWMTLTKQ